MQQLHLRRPVAVPLGPRAAPVGAGRVAQQPPRRDDQVNCGAGNGQVVGEPRALRGTEDVAEGRGLLETRPIVGARRGHGAGVAVEVVVAGAKAGARGIADGLEIGVGCSCGLRAPAGCKSVISGTADGGAGSMRLAECLYHSMRHGFVRRSDMHHAADGARLAKCLHHNTQRAHMDVRAAATCAMQHGCVRHGNMHHQCLRDNKRSMAENVADTTAETVTESMHDTVAETVTESMVDTGAEPVAEAALGSATHGALVKYVRTSVL